MSVSPYQFRHYQNTASRGAGLQVQGRHSIHGHQPFRPLPPPTGTPPYHLSLEQVLPPDTVTEITRNSKLVLHAVGDTGGINYPIPQTLVAGQMDQDFTVADTQAHPRFFYHLGDVVYFYGEAVQYYPQFYEPYVDYPAPIFAIPGNHDGDLSPQMEADNVPSLAAFVDNFCQSISHHTASALDAERTGMTQPNVYWTLETPFAWIIGLYTNVPSGGQLDGQQIDWFQNELRTAPKDTFVLVTMHHPIYSIAHDDYHSGSPYMCDILDQAIEATGVTPHAVFAGHVHNYQRYTRASPAGPVPFIVAGGGGYYHRHQVGTRTASPKPGDKIPADPKHQGDGDVTFEQSCDDRWGFLRLTLTPDTLTGQYLAVQGNAMGGAGQSDQIDTFTLARNPRTLS